MAEKKEEEVIAAAAQVFRRYGYRRVTMGDIAEAAHMSRPALYLVFPSKEEIFTAVVAWVFTAMLYEIRQGLGRFATTEEKLTFAFDVWCVRGFELIQASPDAKDLYESSYQFATEVTTKAAADFVAILAEVLDLLVRRQAKVDLSSVQIAQMLTSAVPGFKGSVKTTEQLRELIAGLITVVLASLGNPEGTEKRRKKSAKQSKA
jgi:AcrR family transcriptional regulator